MTKEQKQQMLAAIEACESKKAENIVILQMDKDSGAFTDFFLICSGANPRQIQTIADEVELQVKRQTGGYAHQVEGYREAEWVLIDYVDFIVHVFSEERRSFYSLERLWKSAHVVPLADFRALKPGKALALAGEAAPARRTAAKAAKGAKRPAKALSSKATSKASSKRAVKKKKTPR